MVVAILHHDGNSRKALPQVLETAEVTSDTYSVLVSSSLQSKITERDVSTNLYPFPLAAAHSLDSREILILALFKPNHVVIH